MRILARSTVYGCNPETDVNKTALKYTWFAERETLSIYKQNHVNWWLSCRERLYWGKYRMITRYWGDYGAEGNDIMCTRRGEASFKYQSKDLFAYRVVYWLLANQLHVLTKELWKTLLY